MGSKQPSNTSQTTNPWKPAEDSLKNILANAGQLFDQTGGINAEWVDKEIADLTPELQTTIRDMVSQEGFQDLAKQIQSGAVSGMEGISQANNLLYQTAKGENGVTGADLNALAKELYQSDRVQSQVDTLGKNVREQLAGETQAINQRAIAAGGMGSSRAGVAEGVAQGKAAEAIAQGSAAIQNEAMGSALNQALATLQQNQSTKASAANALGSLGIQSGSLMGSTSSIINQGLENALKGSSVLQSYEQSKLDNQWANAMGAQTAGWDNLYRYLNAAGTIAGFGAASTYSSPSSSYLGQAGQGAVAGFASGAASSMLSDKRLKDNIIELAPVSEGIYEGQPVPIPALYEWEWNAKGLELAGDQSFVNIGAIAQELLELGLTDLVDEINVSDHPNEEIAEMGSVYVVNYPALFAYIKLVTVGEENDVQA